MWGARRGRERLGLASLYRLNVATSTHRSHAWVSIMPPTRIELVHAV